jgi:hypothetical protein
MLLMGQDLSLKPQYNIPVGQFLVITPDTKGSDVKYVPLTDGLQFLDSSLLKDKKTLVLSASKAGSYKLLAYTAIDNKPSDPVFTTIKVGDNPKPNNELEQIINAVYGADNDSNKSKSKDKLLQGFRLVLTDIDNLNKVGDLNQSIRDKVSSKLVQGECQSLRDVLRDELSNKFGINPEVILDKVEAKKVIGSIVDILGRL